MPSPKEQDRKPSPPATTPTLPDVPSAIVFAAASNGSAMEEATPSQPSQLSQPSQPAMAPPPSAEVALEDVVGSPFKKQRSSLPGFDESVRKKLASDAFAAGARRESESAATGFSSSSAAWPTPSASEPTSAKIFQAGSLTKEPEAEMEEEL